MSIVLPPHRGIGVGAVQHLRTERILERSGSLSMDRSRFRSPPDDACYENEKCSHKERVDTNKSDQRREQRLRWYGRNGIDSSQHAKYHPWLAASLGQVPSAKRGKNTGGRHRDQAAKKPPRCKKP